MGKTKTVEMAGQGKSKEKKKAKSQKKVKTPGLGGGERIKEVSGTPLPKKEEGQKKAKKLPPQLRKTSRGKKYKEAIKKIDKEKAYEESDAIKLVKDTSYSSFDGTVEVHVTCKKEGLAAKVTLPHSTGRDKTIEFADENTLKKLKEGKIDFDILLATKEMMPKLVPFAKVLGPRGLMPNPKNGTLVENKKKADSFNQNTLNLKTDKSVPVIHASIGKVSMDAKKLKDNLDAVLDGIGRRNMTRAHIAATMSPSVKLSL